MKPYLDEFEKVVSNQIPKLEKLGLVSEIKNWNGTAVLKLQKPSWTDLGFAQGVFFSVWIEPKDEKKRIAKYNIHALKLRLREGYTIKANEFAEAFRLRFGKYGIDWPNLSVKYGPQTLFEGWIELDIDRFGSDVEALVDKFLEVQHLIDELLAERKRT